MANLSDSQVLEILNLTNGDTTVLSKANVPTGQIVRVLVNNPDIVETMKKSAAKTVTRYGRFYRDYNYDPTFAQNAVESKWALASPRQAKFALDFWKKVKQQGIDTTTFSAVKANMDSMKDDIIAQYGINENEYDDMMTTFDTDYSDFRDSEQRRQRIQYKAYKEGQKERGITPEDNNVPGLAGFKRGGPDYRTETRDDYLTAATGIVGLGSIPKNVDDYAAQQVSAFKNFAKGKGLDVSRIDALSPQLTGIVKKKVGKNYQNYAIQDLLKRQVTGK
jgi:DNA-directed RNA polymerase delta subunit